MRILIIGATGFIGRELMKELARAGHQPVAVSRNVSKAGEVLGNGLVVIEWDGISPAKLAKSLTGIDAIINLAGENISAKKWTNRRKVLLSQSRLKTGRILTEAVAMSPSKPSVLIQASAIGFYGTPVEGQADESQSAGTGFLSELTKDWESSVAPASGMIPRIIIIRSGLVLGKNGGILEKMLLPFRLCSGSILGSGRQWMSWIHISDEVRAIRFLIENPASSGPYNLTAPNPVRMKEFMAALGESLGKPVWLKVPALFLKIALGEMAGQTILSSQNIYPGKLLNEGFNFEFLELGPALRNLLNGKN
jgi:uncharacterized protein (TIGR01777 family)